MPKKPDYTKPLVIPYMKVLMFGWEYPPHISGGLGTACLGISQSLVAENVNLTFIVPKAYGNEPVGNVRLVNACAVPLPEKDDKDQRPEPGKTKRYTITRQLIQAPGSTVKKTKSISTFTYVEVEASLDPYAVQSIKENSDTIEQWNYEFVSGEDTVVESYEIQENTIKNSKQESGKRTYSFSGKYGANLEEEVEQYAKVAEQVAQTHAHDIIHAHDWMTFAAGIAAKRKSRKPLVVHVHATEVDRSGIGFGKIYELEKKGMEEADAIVAVSQWTKNILINHYGIKPDKIRVIHNGILATKKLNSASAIPMGSHVVTFLGRVTHQKGPRYFVEAARKVLEKFPDAHFIVAGSGDLLPQIIERVAQLKISKNFHFTGFLNQEWIDRIWSISNVYVMPSVSEPFGITPLEAIQSGVPVIVSNQSGVSEVMPHALKVNFWETDALAESICSVLQYKSLSTMLRQKGENEIQNLSWRNTAMRLKHLYHELTK